MKVSLPLQEMSVSDKIRVMEDLWADLVKEGSGYSPPRWHERVLEERKQNVEAGKTGFTDWETAKREIREKTHANPHS